MGRYPTEQGQGACIHLTLKNDRLNKHMRVKNITYNFDPCLVRWRYFRPVCSKITVVQNLHFDTPKIVSYIFEPLPRQLRE